MNPTRPFLRSYWAVPGKLAAGCYPGDLRPTVMDEKLRALAQAGITLVVNLMEEDETDHSGKPFIEYAAPLQHLGRKNGRSLRIERFPIRDQSIPTVGQMKTILESIDREIASGGTVYVHCWGGKGRTATVVGCFLLNEKLETPDTVLDKLRELTSHAHEYFWPTPQTAEQCDFVTIWEVSR